MITNDAGPLITVQIQIPETGGIVNQIGFRLSRLCRAAEGAQFSAGVMNRCLFFATSLAETATLNM